jgi:hypothetical protein
VGDPLYLYTSIIKYDDKLLLVKLAHILKSYTPAGIDVVFKGISIINYPIN